MYFNNLPADVLLLLQTTHFVEQGSLSERKGFDSGDLNLRAFIRAFISSCNILLDLFGNL